MALFSQAIRKVLAVEDGYQNNASDIGNYSAYDERGNFVDRQDRPNRTSLAGTNYGISAETYSTLLKRSVGPLEMKNLPKNTATRIYHRMWDNIQGDFILDQKVAEIFFDGYVNHGSTGVKLMQVMISVFPDGVVGPITLERLNNLPPEKVYQEYIKVRENFYRKLAQRPGQGQFLKGWLRRLEYYGPYGGGSSAFVSTAALIALLWSLA